VADRFTSMIIYHIRHKYRLENRFSRGAGRIAAAVPLQTEAQLAVDR